MKNRDAVSLFLVNLLLFTGVSYAAGNSDDELRQAEIEKTIFIAGGLQDRVLKIAMVDCILYSLKNNKDILIKKIEPEMKKDDVKIAKAAFEPAFTSGFSVEDDTELSSSLLDGSEKPNTQDTNFNAGVSGKLTTGTQYNVEFLNERYKSDSQYQTYNPYYTAKPTITISQPLFRGLGTAVNRADITIARNNLQASNEDFVDKVMDVISRVKTAYYNYLFYLEKYDLEKLSYQRAVDLLKINKARYAKGLISSVDLLETEAAAATREKTVLSAEADLKKEEDDLKMITGLVDDPEVWNAKIELLDKLELAAREVDLLKSLQDAFNCRPDYKAGLIALKNKNIKIVKEKNALLPTVDLVGSFGLNGLGKDYQSALEKINTDYPDWSVGFQISVPWGGAERAKYNQSKLEKAQQLLVLKQLEQNIILEVRDKVRGVKTQYRQIEAAKLSKEKETENYKAQEMRYAAGEVSTHDMLDYQDKLFQAELDYVQALVDYSTAIVNLDRSAGRTLIKNNISIEG